MRVTVGPPGPALSRDDVARRLRGLFPRLAELRWADAERRAEGGVPFSPRADYASAVRDYLGGRLKGDPDRGAVLDLAERYLAERADA